MGFSFSSSRRLLTASGFSQVFGESCCKAGDDAFLVLARRNGLNHARLGLAIAKKQLRRAVDRNRVKRVSRESFRMAQEQLSGMDVVVLCRSGASGLDKAQIRRRVDALFVKIAGLKNR